MQLKQAGFQILCFLLDHTVPAHTYSTLAHFAEDIFSLPNWQLQRAYMSFCIKPGLQERLMYNAIFSTS